MEIGFVLFQNVTQLDFTGPAQFLSRLPDATTHVIADDLGPIKTDCGFSILPTTTFEQAPALDLICIPGGFGTVQAIQSPQLLAQVAAAADPARWVTSVCTGSLVLGAAGLLQAKRATTHWAYTSLLALFGAEHEAGRVVIDGNTITGGGVTAGIDFALTVAKEVGGQALAERLQLGLEYDPMPPTNSGSPRTASASCLQQLTRFYEPQVARARQAILQSTAAGKALGS